MRHLLSFVLFGLLLSECARADDIEAYFPKAVKGRNYVHVLIDPGNTDLDTVLCNFGVDCGPPFMTEAAHAHLADMYIQGEDVTAPGIFKAVLSAVVDKPSFENLYFSLMISNHHENRLSGSEMAEGGGTLLEGYQQLRWHREQFSSTLKSIPLLSTPTEHKLQPKESYFEWLRYLQGGDVIFGDNTVGNFGQTEPAPDFAGNIIVNGRYLAPFQDGEECPGLYSILFTLGESGSDEDLNAELAAALNVTSTVSFEQMLAHLHDPESDLLPDTLASVSLQRTWVVSSPERPGKASDYAVSGGGTEFLNVSKPVELENSLVDALSRITRVKGVQQAVTFTEDVFNPGRILDSLFVPLISPRPNTSWRGNLKKLKLANTVGPNREVEATGGSSAFDEVIDVNGNPAFKEDGADKGQLRLDALTYWTAPEVLPAGDGEIVLPNVDGNVVARGGAGQKIDGFVNYSDGQGGFVHYFIGDTNADNPVNGYPSRRLYFEPEFGQHFEPLNADETTVQKIEPLLDPSDELTDEAAMDLIKWARGQDTDGASSSARRWIMSEILHSQPLALNYGATAGYSRENPNIRLLFGSGEGVFHIVENTDTRGNESGREIFGFYPRTLLANIRWRHENLDSKPYQRYGVDGAPVALKIDRNGDGTIDFADGDKAFVYFGLRRGGASYFALDVSNPNTVPTLLWKIDPAASAGFDSLGLSFSTPLVGKVNYRGVPEDVLIFGGGYNGGWNTDFSARTGKDLGAEDDAVGNAIYIVNAHTGSLVWKAEQGSTGVSSNTHFEHKGLVDSIPSKVSALVTPEGVIHRAYVGDTGGAVWRLDLPQSSGGSESHRKDSWFITKLADLGFDAAEFGGAQSDDRRFFHAPDIVRSFDNVGSFDGILIQSGNRANPNGLEVENFLFYLKDRQTESGSEAARAQSESNSPLATYHFSDIRDQTDCIEGSEPMLEGAKAIPCAEHILENGWKLRYERAGEKGLSPPFTDGGRVFSSTFTPGDGGTCPAQPGTGRLYVTQLNNATAVGNKQRYFDLGTGIPAAAVPVGDLIYLPGGGIDLYDLNGDGLADNSKLLPSHAGKMYRTYWREPENDPL